MDGDDDNIMSYHDFDKTQDGRTAAERRMGGAQGAGSRNGSQAGGSNGGSGKSSGFGKKLLKGSSKLLGGVTAAVGDGVSAVAGGVSSGKVGEALSGAVNGSVSAVSSVGKRLSQTGGNGQDPPPVSAPAGNASGYPSGSAPANGNASGPAGRASGMLAGGMSAVTAGASLVAGGLAGGVKAANSLVTNGAGTSAGTPSAELAVGLVSATFELMAAAVPACGADKAADEVAAHIDATAGTRNLNDLGARILDFWYVLRPDALSPWSLLHQRQWVTFAYAVKYGDLTRAPGPLARVCCGLLLELANGCRPAMLTWAPGTAQAWVNQVHFLAQLAEDTPPPAGWGFPPTVIARNAPGLTELEFGQTSYSIERSDVKGFATAHGKEALLSLKSGGLITAKRPTQLVDSREGSARPAARDLLGAPEQLIALAGGPPLQKKCDEKGARLFTQKTKPIHLHNQASTALKACLYSDTDRMCVVPVGGMGGPCVATLEPNCRAQMRPPGTAERFQLKIIQPGLIEKNLYFVNVNRGQAVQLRSHDCTVEEK